MSVTQFIWKEALRMSEFSPPEPKSKKPKYGPDDVCWLCAGDTDKKGWHIKDVIGSAFTDVNSAAFPTSQTICYSCAALMKKEAWEMACNKHGHSPYFPAKDGKEPFMSNWMFSSHVISKDGWIIPTRAQMRDILIDPPRPPFVITIADKGKIHVLFKSQVSQSVDDFFINYDDQTIHINRVKFTKILNDVEDAYEFFSKESMLTGNYNQAAILAAGIEKWREIDNGLKIHRAQYADMLKVAVFVAKKDVNKSEVK